MNNPDDDGLFDPNRSSAILSDNLHIIENIMFVGLFLFFCNFRLLLHESKTPPKSQRY